MLNGLDRNKMNTIDRKIMGYNGKVAYVYVYGCGILNIYGIKKSEDSNPCNECSMGIRVRNTYLQQGGELCILDALKYKCRVKDYGMYINKMIRTLKISLFVSLLVLIDNEN